MSDPRVTYQKIASLLIEASKGLALEQFEQMAIEALEDVSPNEIAEIANFLPIPSQAVVAQEEVQLMRFGLKRCMAAASGLCRRGRICLIISCAC